MSSAAKEAALLFVASLALCACGGDGEAPVDTFEAGIDVADAGMEPCAPAQEGTSCGEGKVCVAGRCALALCGDGMLSAGEECDDGNQDHADGCTPSCRRALLTCGDALVQEGEECDDGNWYDLDLCSTTCHENRCGNSRQDGVEECDDGNRVDDDACSNACQENRCRNGRLDPGEECDDGNRIHDDGCSNGCLAMACGNARTEGEALDGDEECDDGNMVDGDSCSNRCTRNECGNLRLDPGEVCDGDSGEMDCADDCLSAVSNEKCSECRVQHCSNYMGALDLIAECVAAQDPDFEARCNGVVDCAHAHGCGFGAAGAEACFCGDVDINTCQTPGAANGPCQDEWYAAANTTSLAEMLGRFSDVSLPSGMAYYLLQCERELCAVECGP